MLLSMTGYGEARSKLDGRSAWVEVRTINGRYFKLSTKCLEAYNALEPDIEQVVRRQIRRGSVQVTLRVERPRTGDKNGIDAAALDGYRQQLHALFEQWCVDDPLPYGALLALPGVIVDQAVSSAELAEDWPLIERTLEAALANLAGMRTKEGAAMAADLAENCRQIAAEFAQVESRAPWWRTIIAPG